MFISFPNSCQHFAFWLSLSLSFCSQLPCFVYYFSVYIYLFFLVSSITFSNCSRVIACLYIQGESFKTGISTKLWKIEWWLKVPIWELDFVDQMYVCHFFNCLLEYAEVLTLWVLLVSMWQVVMAVEIKRHKHTICRAANLKDMFRSLLIFPQYHRLSSQQ